MTLIHSATFIPHGVHIPAQSCFMHGVSYGIGFRIALIGLYA